MNKKTVELSSKKKVEIKEMLQDECDICEDMQIAIIKDGQISHFTNLAQARTAGLRRAIIGGDFKKFKTDVNGYPEDSVLKQLTDDEKNELLVAIREYQELGE